MNLKIEIVKIGSKLNVNNIKFSEFEKVRNEIILVCKAEFIRLAGENKGNVMLKKVYDYVNSQWIAAVKELHEKGFALYKISGFKNIMKDWIKTNENLKCLEKYIQ